MNYEDTVADKYKISLVTSRHSPKLINLGTGLVALDHNISSSMMIGGEILFASLLVLQWTCGEKGMQ